MRTEPEQPQEVSSSVAIDDDLLTFDPKFGITANTPVVRDDETALVTVSRSRNADAEWELRKYEIEGDGVKFNVTSRGQADLAAVFVEAFDGEQLARSDSWSPVRRGVPTAVAVDGKPAIAAWLEVRGLEREEIGEQMGVSAATVREYLHRFRRRGDGIGVEDAPAVGEIMPEIPPRFDPQAKAAATDGGVR